MMSDLRSTYDDVVVSEAWRCTQCGRLRKEHICLKGFSRQHYEFVGMLRIRNEARWLAEVLESIRPLCEMIYVLDDHSTDDSASICQRYDHVRVLASPFTGLNEARDKNYLYDQIIADCAPAWILCIDGDEVLERAGQEIIRAWCAITEAQSAKLKIEFLWGGRATVRVDRVYGDFWRPSLFRPFHEDPDKPDDQKILRECRWLGTPFGRQRDGNPPNLHCSSVPQRFLHGAKLLPARLKHYGYMLREDRVNKLDYYTSIDWKNDAEDWYRHMCQGDRVTSAELPRVRELVRTELMTQTEMDRLFTDAQDQLVHAGPLVLAPWNEEAPWVLTPWAKAQS